MWPTTCSLWLYIPVFSTSSIHLETAAFRHVLFPSVFDSLVDNHGFFHIKAMDLPAKPWRNDIWDMASLHQKGSFTVENGNNEEKIFGGEGLQLGVRGEKWWIPGMQNFKAKRGVRDVGARSSSLSSCSQREYICCGDFRGSYPESWLPFHSQGFFLPHCLNCETNQSLMITTLLFFFWKKALD